MTFDNSQQTKDNYHHRFYLLSAGIVQVRRQLGFMCSKKNLKYWIPLGFPSTSSLLMDYQVNQYTHTHVRTAHSCLQII